MNRNASKFWSGLVYDDDESLRSAGQVVTLNEQTE